MHKKSRNYQNVGKQNLFQKTDALDSRDHFKFIGDLSFPALKRGLGKKDQIEIDWGRTENYETLLMLIFEIQK